MSNQADKAPTEVRINLHNHTTWSDGAYSSDQIVRAAIAHGLTHVGISDHYYTAKLEMAELYVSANEIAAYLADLHALADLHTQADTRPDGIVVLAGLEVDWSPRSAAQLPVLWPALDAFDYVLFEYVGDPGWYGDSLAALVEALPAAHIPVGLAHNDLSANFRPLGFESLIALLEEHDIFVELSTWPSTAYYARNDPHTRRLWDLLARSRVAFSVGSDTHARLDDVGRIAGAHQFLAERGLLGRLITARMDRCAARMDRCAARMDRREACRRALEATS